LTHHLQQNCAEFYTAYQKADLGL